MLWDFEKTDSSTLLMLYGVIKLISTLSIFRKHSGEEKFFFQILEKKMHYALDNIVLGLHINFQINPMKTLRKERNRKYLNSA